jgi:hypothetical protein
VLIDYYLNHVAARGARQEKHAEVNQAVAQKQALIQELNKLEGDKRGLSMLLKAGANEVLKSQYESCLRAVEGIKAKLQNFDLNLSLA